MDLSYLKWQPADCENKDNDGDQLHNSLLTRHCLGADVAQRTLKFTQYEVHLGHQIEHLGFTSEKGNY